jgi:hypothetical protein
MSAFADLTYFNVVINNLHGQLPALPYDKMPKEPGHTGCYLLGDSEQGGTNAFECPWPQHVVGNCYKYGRNGRLVLITEEDCREPTFRCTDGECVSSPIGTSKENCLAMCTPELYKCVANACTPSFTGVSKDICEAGCGTVHPQMREGSSISPLERDHS